jgi:tetratricopeptide (TPR) repeat protein
LRAFNENYDVGTIVLYRIGKTSGPVSATSENAPPTATKAFDKGLESLGKGKNADAEKDFEKAVGLYPQYADAWLALGKLRMQRKAQDSAVEAFQKAAEADEALVEPHLQLGMIAVGKKQWPDAAKQLDIVVRLDPVHFPDAWYNNAVAGYNLKNYDGAEKSVRELIKLDPKRRNGQAGFLLGVILAGKSDFNGAAEELRAFIKASPDAPDVPQAKDLLAQIEKLQTPRRP